MADLRLEKQSALFGSFTTVSLAGCYGFKVSYSKSSSGRMEFRYKAEEQTLPFLKTDFLRFWDHGADHPISGTQSSSAPLFEGWVEDVQPGDHANEVVVTAFTPDYRATQHGIIAMSKAWTLDSFDVPQPGVGASARVVYNVTIENDDDFKYAILLRASIGDILGTVLSDQYLPLYHVNAAPGDGTALGNGIAYYPAELDGGSSSSSGSANIRFEPQGKFVATNESVRSLCERILQQWEPRYTLFWEPGSRKWRFFDSTSSPAVDLYFNDPDATTGIIENVDIRRVFDGRYAAVEFYGPDGVEWRTAYWKDPDLSSSSGDIANTLDVVISGGVDINGVSTGDCINGLVITDPDFTRIAREGPYDIEVPAEAAVWARQDGTIVDVLAQTTIPTRYWSLQVQYASSDGGDGLWHTYYGYNVDVRTGEIDLGTACLYRYTADPVSSATNVELPREIRFIYPATTDPLMVRYPSSGFDGTINTVAGMENVHRIYDEDLAVGREYGTPVTTETRLLRFRELAQQIHAKEKDIAYTGGAVLEGLEYQFAFLNKRINLKAKGPDGTDKTTGWESINAIVTDVEYDFEERRTTLQVGSDVLEANGVNTDLLKEQLKIRRAEPFMFWSASAFLGTRYAEGFGPNNIAQIIGVQYSQTRGFVDQYGELQ